MSGQEGSGRRLSMEERALEAADIDWPAFTIEKAIATAAKHGWCTKWGCTTCGNGTLLQALKRIPRERLIGQLQGMSSEARWRLDHALHVVLRVVAVEADGSDLLPFLRGTPAGAWVKGMIGARILSEQRWAAFLATQTPEAKAKRRADRRLRRLAVTEAHRDRKRTNQAAIERAGRQLAATPVYALLDLAGSTDLGVPARAAAGLVYQRLKDHFLSKGISDAEISILSTLASRHRGYWAKLLAEIERRIPPADSFFEPSRE